MEEILNESDSCEEYEETEDNIKLFNNEEFGNHEILDAIQEENKKYNYTPEKMIESNLVPRSFSEVSLIGRKFSTICKILDGSHPGTGFFCKFIINGKIKKALFTNYSVLKSSQIKVGSEINILHEQSIKTLKITKNRFISSSKELGYICIEILPEDNINNFLQVEHHIYDIIMGESSIESIIEEYKFHKLILIQYKTFNEKSQIGIS